MRSTTKIFRSIAPRGSLFQDKGKTINGETNKYLKLVSVGHLVILRNAVKPVLHECGGKNLQGSGLNLLNNAEILRSYLTQNDKIGLHSNLG